MAENRKANRMTDQNQTSSPCLELEKRNHGICLSSHYLNFILFIAAMLTPRMMSSQERQLAITAAIQSIKMDKLSYQAAAELHGVNLRTLYRKYPVPKKYLPFSKGLE